MGGTKVGVLQTQPARVHFDSTAQITTAHEFKLTACPLPRTGDFKSILRHPQTSSRDNLTGRIRHIMLNVNMNVINGLAYVGNA